MERLKRRKMEKDGQAGVVRREAGDDYGKDKLKGELMGLFSKER